MMSSPSYKYNIAPDTSYLEKYFKPEAQPLYASLVKSHKDFPWKDDDVVVCSYPRSGTHLGWHIVRRILQKSPDMPKDPVEEAAIDFFTFQDKQKEGRRVWAAHALPYDFTDDVIFKGNRKFLYVMRNPKDVIVSGYNIAKDFQNFLKQPLTDWNSFVERFANNEQPATGRSWFDHVRAWAEYTDAKPDAPILPVWFEDIQQKAMDRSILAMPNSFLAKLHPHLARIGINRAQNSLTINFQKTIQDRKATLRKISDFIGVDLSEEILDAICDGIQFQKAKQAPISDKLENVGLDAKPNFYRKGQVGDWKNHFTVAQNELLDSQVQKLLAGFKWKIVYE